MATCQAGGFMAYAYNLMEIFHQIARQVNEILRGANPGEMPFYQPIKFDLLINMSAAKAIGVTVPRSLLARADEVIE
jgi:putative ABC transport system substrate-binding protein